MFLDRARSVNASNPFSKASQCRSDTLMFPSVTVNCQAVHAKSCSSQFVLACAESSACPPTCSPALVLMQRTIQQACQLAAPMIRMRGHAVNAPCASALAFEHASVSTRHFAAVPSYQEAATQQAPASDLGSSATEYPGVRAQDAASHSDLPEHTAGTLLIDTLKVMKCANTHCSQACSAHESYVSCLHQLPSEYSIVVRTHRAGLSASKTQRRAVLDI